MTRDSFTQSVKDELAKRVGYVCSNPGCRQHTSGPQKSPRGTVNVGVAAHITAASPSGPRYDPSLSTNERTYGGNGIWLCQNCAKLVDSDQPKYDVEKLHEWKSDAEAAAARALEHRKEPPSESEGVFLEAERLMPALIEEMRNNVRGDDTKLVTEFVVLSSSKIVFNSVKPRFGHYEEEHPELLLQVDWLKEMGLIIDVTPKSTPIYRMVPEFRKWLRLPK